MKRTFLFVITNIAVMIAMMVAFHVVCALLGVEPNAAFKGTGLDLTSLAVFSLVFGMGGAVVSLLLSKTIAKMSVGAQVIDGTEGEAERWLVETVRVLAERANVQMPEVAIYRGEANAFATGAFRNHALVAVSTKIMEQMTREELRAVLGHEMSHVANGDMVTTTLVQGVLNVFVLFLSRLVAAVASNAAGNGRGSRGGSARGIYYLVYYVMHITLGIVASLIVCWHSRRREYAADAGSANLLGSPSSMIAALRRLDNLRPGILPESLKAMGINGRKTSLFATHPSIDDRVAALERLQRGI
ncbi:MAG: protease HtpX [Kiritimatiellae bacterium]|nr:protease HtpX [Kiritimatiellia bacterium]